MVEQNNDLFVHSSIHPSLTRGILRTSDELKYTLNCASIRDDEVAAILKEIWDVVRGEFFSPLGEKSIEPSNRIKKLSTKHEH